MSTPFLPGPWRVAPASNYASSEIHVDADTRGFVALCGHRGDKQAEANARLIAASPIMFDFIARHAKDGDREAQSILSKLV